MSIRKKGNIDPAGDHKRIREEVIRELRQIGLDAKGYMLDYLEKHNIDYRGDLAKSIRSEVTELLRRIRLEFGSGARHGIFVHDGTKPHWIGKDTDAGKAIRRWVIKELRPKGSEIDRTTFLVRRKIARKGTDAKPYAGVTMRLIRRQIPKRLNEAIERGIRRAG